VDIARLQSKNQKNTSWTSLEKEMWTTGFRCCWQELKTELTLFH